ncbi:MAG: tRNA epoxyqueuosine(34) reductase QueG [Candidatus Symbiobacter sp.]|nr:tRNA epoxyqueuosine(34) reductase QueG [Candidatus Symbiobacter sp.]
MPDPYAQLRQIALTAGFDAVGFAPADLSLEVGERLQQFLAAGWHGDMGWLAARAPERSQPRNLWPAAKTVMMVGHNYAPNYDPESRLGDKDRATISAYAQNRDYHDVMKKKLRELARAAAKLWACEVKIFVDTAPVMEKPLAALAGLGWQGKHTNLVSRQFGSYLFLGAVFLAVELPFDQGETDHCGRCTSCLDACPTKAFAAPYQLNATRCLSYLTIEHKGVIPREFRAALGNRVYGCDTCLAVCPWNKFSTVTTETAYLSRSAGPGPPVLADAVTWDDFAFRRYFAGSPVKRIGHTRFLRNLLLAIGNSGDESLVPLVLSRLSDPSPLVRGAAVWALARLSRTALAAAFAAFGIAETDESVRQEWCDEGFPTNIL